MSTKITSNQPQPAAPTLQEASAGIVELIKHAQAAAQSAPTTPSPSADHIADAAPRADEALAALIQGSRPQTTPPPSIDLGLHMDLPDLIRPNTIRDLLDRSEPLSELPFKPSPPAPQRIQLSAATHLSVASLIGAAPTPKPTLPAEIERACDNLPDALPAEGDAKVLARALPGALNVAGLDLLGTDAKCAIALKDTLDQPAQLRATLTASLAKNPAFQRLDAEGQRHVVDAAVKHIETRFSKSLCGLVNKEVVSHIQGARSLTESLNMSPATRRQTLIHIAARGPDLATIQRNLGKLGFDPKQCASVAPLLERLHSALKTGAAQPLLAGPAFGDAVTTLQSALDRRCGQLDQLERQANNDHFKNDRILRSEIFASARAAIFDRLEITPGSGAADVIARSTAAAKKVDDHEENMITAINIAGGVLSGGITTGIIGTIITGGIGALPSLTIAQNNLEGARVAEQLGVAGKDAVEEAGGERNAAIVNAALGLLIDGVIDGAEVSKLGLKGHVKAMNEAHLGDVVQSTAQELIKGGAGPVVDKTLKTPR
jgi:hypothetical protein